MNTPLNNNDIWSLAARSAAKLDTPLEQIKQNGKLTHALMHVRQKVIQDIHATGLYRRQVIADFFGLSVCTVTASLTPSQKAKSLPFAPEEDAVIASMYRQGRSIPQIKERISTRSASSIRRRLTHLKKTDPSICRTLEPSYQGAVPSLMLRLARLENSRMRDNL